MRHEESPAFPQSDGCGNGLTKREYFAGLALQGLLSHPGPKPPEMDRMSNRELKAHYAEVAVQYADALIAELNKE